MPNSTLVLEFAGICNRFQQESLARARQSVLRLPYGTTGASSETPKRDRSNKHPSTRSAPTSRSVTCERREHDDANARPDATGPVKARQLQRLSHEPAKRGAMARRNRARDRLRWCVWSVLAVLGRCLTVRTMRLNGNESASCAHRQYRACVRRCDHASQNEARDTVQA